MSSEREIFSTFSGDFDGIDSIVSRGLHPACSQSGAYFANRQLTWYSRQDTGLVGTVGVLGVCHRINYSRAARTSLRKISSVYVKGEGGRGMGLKL